LIEEDIREDGRTFGRGLANLIIISLADRITDLGQTETEELLESSIRFWSSIKRAKNAAGLPDQLADVWDDACRTAFRDRFIEHVDYLRAAAELLGMDPSQAPKN
jgi:hypothetical protein